MHRRDFLQSTVALGTLSLVPAYAFAQVSHRMFMETIMEFGTTVLPKKAADHLVNWVDDNQNNIVVRKPPETFSGKYDSPYQFAGYRSYFSQPTIVSGRVLAVGGLTYVVKNDEQPSYVTSLNGPEMVGLGDRRNRVLWSPRGNRLPVTVSERQPPTEKEQAAFQQIYGDDPDLSYVRQFCGCDGPLTGFGFVENRGERGKFEVVDTTWA